MEPPAWSLAPRNARAAATATAVLLTAASAVAAAAWLLLTNRSGRFQESYGPSALGWAIPWLLRGRPRASSGELAERSLGRSDLDASEETERTPELEDLVNNEGESLFSATRQPWKKGEELKVRKRPAAVKEEDLQNAESEACCGGGSCGSTASAHLPGRQKIFVKTYGCAHNNSDSEFMMGLLKDYGYTLVERLEDADACVVNSCTVKGPSQDSATNLVNAAKIGGKPVVLAGCVPSADAALVKSMEGVSMLGVTQLDRVVEIMEEALKGHSVSLLAHRKSLPSLDLPKVRKNKHVEIIPISGGCYSEEAIVGRALQAAAEGVSEVWLTSEDTGAYGLDIGTDIASLLRRIADALPPKVMLKLGMTNPPYMLAHIDAVAEVLRRPNVFEFLHVPVQSGSDPVLRAMIREYSSDDFRTLVDGLRKAVPNMLVATDVICGFPAEGEEDHQNTLDLVREYRFPILNISQFYPRPGTAAARLKRLDGKLVKARSTEMTKLFESYTTWDGLVGRDERVWFCETDTRHGQTVGHTKGYAKVVVPQDDSLLGGSAIVHLHKATKWHVEGRVLRVIA
eukprot:CAMPEP_0115107856 /NCGR_PEP_ID=MMETSP0227-20121206/37581_1 /TAXON_ID=89957 /ORGANISM="Polarella glacialis, Strain CCMP 1383" /LENGTH=569 /DNA_ID=CAMNT_0002505887 /DNA_START=49 /DNA_END=1758 /DNA_ORIENTATION=+